MTIHTSARLCRSVAVSGTVWPATDDSLDFGQRPPRPFGDVVADS